MVLTFAHWQFYVLVSSDVQSVELSTHGLISDDHVSPLL